MCIIGGNQVALANTNNPYSVLGVGYGKVSETYGNISFESDLLSVYFGRGISVSSNINIEALIALGKMDGAHITGDGQTLKLSSSEISVDALSFFIRTYYNFTANDESFQPYVGIDIGYEKIRIDLLDYISSTSDLLTGFIIGAKVRLNQNIYIVPEYKIMDGVDPYSVLSISLEFRF